MVRSLLFLAALSFTFVGMALPAIASAPGPSHAPLSQPPTTTPLSRAVETLAARPSLAPATLAGTTAWVELGPRPIVNPNNTPVYGTAPFSGRVTSIAVNGSNPSILYIGGAQGGVWKSSDGGATWTPLTDNQKSLAIGAITISPDSKTVYAGTGEPNHSGDSQFGEGLLKSTDGGKTWVTLGSDYFNSSAISQVLLFRADANRLVVSTTYAYCCRYSAFVENPGGIGIYLSTDGGATWTQTMSSTKGISNLIADPSNSATLYAGDFAGAVWKSTDGGATWSKFLSYSSASQQGRVVVAMSPAAPGSVYQAFSDSLGNFTGAFRYDTSTSQENSLSPLPTAPPTNGPCYSQCDYDFELYVDPTNSNIIYLGTVGLFRSTDGGTTWTGLGGVVPSVIHPDQHAFAFLPGSASTIFVGSDGGVWKSVDRGNTWINLNSNLGLAQFESITGAPTGLMFGGTQDNGCEQYTGLSSWSLLTSGDGGWTGFEASNQNIMYCTYYNLNFQKSTDGGRTFNLATTGFNLNDPVRFYAPVAQDVNNPGTLYIGSVRVYKTSNYAQSWTDVSGVLGTAKITSLAVATSNGNTLYLGDASGNVKVSFNGGATWQLVGSVPNTVVNGIAADPSNDKVVYVVFGASHIPRKFALQSGTWLATQLATLASHPDVIRLSPTGKALYIGTDSGVVYSTDGGNSWASPGKGLPNVAVWDLAITPANQLVAATHGRGVWVVTPTTPTSITLTVSYSVQGGGSGFSPPVLTYVSGGAQQTAILSRTSTTYNLDPGSGWSVSNPLTGSSQMERWNTNQLTSGTIGSSLTLVLVYFHQFYASFSYNVVGGGSGYSPPLVGYPQFGVTNRTSVGTSVWVDSAGSYSFPSQLNGSSSSERWSTPAATGIVSSSNGVSATYYHQYSISASYGIVGGGAPIPPTFSYASLGGSNSVTLGGSPQQLWADSGGAYSLTDPLGGSTTQERWASPAAAGTVLGPGPLNVQYHHQFLLTVSGSPVFSTSTPSPTQDTYFDAGSSLTVTTPYTWNAMKDSRQSLVSYVLDGRSMNVSRAESGNYTTPALAFDRPHVLSFNSVTQYLVSFAFTNASGSTPIVPTEVQVSIFQGQTKEASSRELWLDSSTSFTLSKVIWQDTDVKPSTALVYTVGGPLSLSIHTRVYDVALKVTDFLGQPVGGAHVALTLVNGTAIGGTTAGDGSFVAKNIPIGTFTGTVSNLGISARVSGNASTQAITGATVLLSTTTLSVTIAILAAAGLGVFLFIRRKRT